MSTSFFDHLTATAAAGQSAALGVITGVKGSSPQKIGAKAIFHADGRIDGTLGGGCLEAEIQDRARRSLLSGTAAMFELVLDHDFGWDDGLVCGGKVSGVILPGVSKALDIWRRLATRLEPMTWGIRKDFSIDWACGDPTEWIYQENVHPPCGLWIAGAGHVAQAVAPIALKLDFDVWVADDRPGLANHQYFPNETHFRVGSWEEIFVAELPRHVPTFGLIVTRGHRHDALVLRDWINRPFAFLGMIGSKRKWRLISSQFVEDHIATQDQLARVACPVGVDIEAVSVPEIAVSIMAQYVQKRAGIMRQRSGPKSIAPGENAEGRLRVTACETY